MLRGLLVGASTHGLLLVVGARPRCYLINGLGLDWPQGEESNFSRHRVSNCMNRVYSLIFGMALRGADGGRCIIAAADIVDGWRP